MEALSLHWADSTSGESKTYELPVIPVAMSVHVSPLSDENERSVGSLCDAYQFASMVAP